MAFGNEIYRYQAIKDRMLAVWPELDSETLADTLEGITDLHEMIAAVIRSALVDEALYSGLRLRLGDMKERLSRLELRASKKREVALHAMTEAGLNKLEQPDFTASARAGSPALVVIAEDQIPQTYWLPQPPKLDRQSILAELKRSADVPGAQMSNPYVEGWHVIAEANRIFGYDAWDRRTLASRCVWNGQSGGCYGAAYTAKVRVSVRAGDITIVREGSGTGEGKAPTPGQAHELALKGAETDATKRALATFGNPFGLALYDREQLGVRKARCDKTSLPIGPWMLRSASGAEEASFDKPSEFAGALRKAMSETNDIELLFAIWEQNVDTVRALNRSLKQEQLPKSGIAPQLVTHLKRCAIALVKPESRANGSDPS
jgi:hypothetical protein